MQRILKQWHLLSLQWKSALTLGLALALLFGLFGLIAVQTLNQSTDAALQERLAFARMTANGVDDLIANARHGLEGAAAMPALALGNLQQQTAALATIIHVIASYDTVRLLDSQGRVLWEESSKDGENPVAEGDLLVWREVAPMLATGETVVAQMVPTLSSHPPIAVILAPVMDPEGNLRNVLQGNLHLSHMGGELVPLPKLSATSYSAIVDSQGNILATSEGSRNEASPEIEEHLKLMADFISQSTLGVAIHHEPEGDHVVAFAPLSTLGGGVIVEELEDVVLAVPQRLQSMLLVFGSSALLYSSLGAWFYIRRVVQPLLALSEATTSIAQGQLENPITIDRGDEIGELGQSFETMRQQLLMAREEQRRWEAELEERVRLRTAQVHQLVGKILSAQEEERRRIARELHDGPAQSIATLMLHLTAVEESMSSTDETNSQRQLSHRASSYALSTLHEIRRMMQDLRPSALDDMGLVAGVRWFAITHMQAEGIHIQFQTSGEVPILDHNVETAVFRILQEAINNAARHAQASSISVTLDFVPRLLHAMVEDDGIGFDVEQSITSGGLGVVGMKERANLVGGQLTIHSRPGSGTRVDLEVPLGG